MDLFSLQYPIGKYQPVSFSAEEKEIRLQKILYLPQYVEAALLNLDEAQLEVPYRPNGWNSKQVVHHLVDSHCMAYTRTKLTLTQHNPTILPYEESEWVKAADIEFVPTNMNITLLHVLHVKWWHIWKNLSAEQWERTYYHPEYQQTFTLWHVFGLYAWHGQHHVEQINALRTRMNW